MRKRLLAAALALCLILSICTLQAMSPAALKARPTRAVTA